MNSYLQALKELKKWIATLSQDEIDQLNNPSNLNRILPKLAD